MSRSADSRGAFRRIVLLVIASAAASATLAAGTSPRFGFGKPVSEADLAAWDIDVRPDGKGLPEGSGGVMGGEAIYEAKCASCHGSFGESNEYHVLAGGVGSLKSAHPERTTGSKLNHATTLFDYIHRAMPYNAPQSLTDDEVYALTAYVLYLNDIVGDDLVLDRESLPKLVMPNAEGFYPGVGFMSVDGEPDVKAPACMKNCPMSGEETSSLPESVRGAHGNLALQSRPLGYIRQGESTAEVQAAVAGGGATAVAEVAPETLAEQVGCLACHAVVGTRKLGPSFNEVQARYQAEAGARAMLLAKLEAGGAGNWGEMPMPSVSYLPATDRERLVDWILSTPATGATP